MEYEQTDKVNPVYLWWDRGRDGSGIENKILEGNSKDREMIF